MPRQLRHHVPGGWYHITTRGLGKCAIFKTDRDHEHFAELLSGMVERYSIIVHAYALMTTHYHLLIESPEGNVSQAMQWLNTSYSVWFNIKHDRAGALFQYRFKSIPVDNEGSWAFECAMYIHLNPVRIKGLGLGKEDRAREKAGMLPEEPKPDLILKRLEVLRNHRWSSYPAYAGYVEKPAWLYCDELWRRGSDGGSHPEKAYREWLEENIRQGVEEKNVTRLSSSLVIGSVKFKAEVRRLILKDKGGVSNERKWRRMLPFSDVMEAVSDVKNEPCDVIVARRGGWGRDLALYVGQARCGLSLKELGKYTNMKPQAVCNAVNRFKNKMNKDDHLKECYRLVLKKIDDA